jgi:NTP pyrophosphatase (non-canonical NTP hydrolase)
VDVGCEVISPADLEFTDELNGFVLSRGQSNPAHVEATHLASICRADFVWLHVANGYVGRSASMEIGFANAIGVPVFSDERPDDEALASLVRIVGGPAEALESLENARLPELGRPLRVLQAYYSAVAKDRGYDSETPQDVMLLLTEEVGELARAIRKKVGLIREVGYGEENAGEELADIQLYLVHLANALGVDLADAVSRKEAINSQRFSENQETVPA